MMMEVSRPPEYARTTFFGLGACLFTKPLCLLFEYKLQGNQPYFLQRITGVWHSERGSRSWHVSRFVDAKRRPLREGGYRVPSDRGRLTFGECACRCSPVLNCRALAESPFVRTYDFRIGRGPRIAARREFRR